MYQPPALLKGRVFFSLQAYPYPTGVYPPSPMAKHLETGANGEALAANYLVQQGVEILQRNYRYKHWEIDLVARHAGELVFVEVKTRQQGSLARPEEQLPPQKRATLVQCAQAYLMEHPAAETLPARFDLVAVEVAKGRPPLVRWHKAAFRPD